MQANKRLQLKEGVMKKAKINPAVFNDFMLRTPMYKDDGKGESVSFFMRPSSMYMTQKKQENNNVDVMSGDFFVKAKSLTMLEGCETMLGYCQIVFGEVKPSLDVLDEIRKKITGEV